MRYEEGEVRMPGPRLPLVLAELADRLLADDWCPCSTTNGERKYYILGFEAHLEHSSGEADFPLTEFPLSADTGPISEWFIRSQRAESHKDYLREARSRLIKAGVDADSIQKCLAG